MKMKILVLFCIIVLSVLMIGCNGEAPNILVFSADPECIEVGESSELTWAVSGADTVVIIPAEYSTLPLDLSGSYPTSPTATAVFTLTAANSYGSTVATLTVQVGGCDRVHNLTQVLHYVTIQEALDGADSGDTIEADDGIYDESITFPSGKAIILQSVNGSSLTTIRGDDNSYTVYLFGSYGTIIEGFTITHAAGHSGGGISNQGITEVTACTISSNSADQGGGIYNHNSSQIWITASTVGKNTAIDKGGGIYNHGKMEITASTIFGNSADHSGGGIANFGILTTTDASTISDNSAEWGGGIANYGSLYIRGESIISGNIANEQGGGIYNEEILTITASTISDNSAVHLSGGGIYINYGSPIPTIGGNNSAERNTICGNYKNGNNPSLDQQIRDSSGDLYSTYEAYNYICADCADCP